MLAERKPYGHAVGVVADGADDMRALVGAAGAGAAAGGADIVNVEVEQKHFRFLGFGKRYIQHRV